MPQDDKLTFPTNHTNHGGYLTQFMDLLLRITYFFNSINFYSGYLLIYSLIPNMQQSE